MARIDSFLEMAVDQQASDLHLSADRAPIIRHDGDLMRLPFRPLSHNETRRLLEEILDEDQRARLRDRQEVDLVYHLEGVGRFRICAYEQCAGPAATFRVIPQAPPTMEELLLPPSIVKLTSHTSGLVLVTGPTGSGKTTTLAAIVNEINRYEERHIITIEDPVEFIHEPIRSVITHRQVGIHTKSFGSALRSALRESPDVLVIGELRDYRSMSLAISAAETGALVFGTLHTNSASAAISRIVDITPEAARPQVLGVLSVMLRGVIAQKLCKRASGDGRIAVIELLLQNYAVSNMIRENKVHQLDAYMQSAGQKDSGMQGFDQGIIHLVAESLITPEDGVALARNPDQVKSAIVQIASLD